MMMMTAKVRKKQLLMILAGIAAAICLVYLASRPEPSGQEGSSPQVLFLRELGWEVSREPVESGPVRVPDQPSRAFQRYNALQKSQGYDLSPYAGQTLMRYQFLVTNYPGARAPVYATLLMQGSTVVGGDITDTAPGGKLQSLRRPAEPQPSETTLPPTQPESTDPSLP